MSSKTKWLLITVGVLALILVVVGIAWMSAKKAGIGPAQEPAAPIQEPQSGPRVERFSLGEFTAITHDEEPHYIKLEVELGYVGNISKELEERKGELRDAVTTILMKLTAQRAKEDYIDHFLHKDIEKTLNNVLGKSSSESRIVKVFIPVFLIN